MLVLNATAQKILRNLSFDFRSCAGGSCASVSNQSSVPSVPYVLGATRLATWVVGISYSQNNQVLQPGICFVTQGRRFVFDAYAFNVIYPSFESGSRAVKGSVEFFFLQKPCFHRALQFVEMLKGLFRPSAKIIDSIQCELQGGIKLVSAVHPSLTQSGGSSFSGSAHLISPREDHYKTGHQAQQSGCQCFPFQVVQLTANGKIKWDWGAHVLNLYPQHSKHGDKSKHQEYACKHKFGRCAKARSEGLCIVLLSHLAGELFFKLQKDLNLAPKVALSSKKIAQCARKCEISSPTDTTGFECRASLPPSQQRWKGMDMRKRKSSTLLTARHRRRMVWPINGKNPLWGSKDPLKTASRHVSCGYFCARNPGASRLWREGGENKTRKGNKPACLLTGSYPPATSAVVRSRSGGVVKRRQEGFDMTDDIDGRIPSETFLITPDNAPVRGLSRAERAAINRRATDVATMLFPYVRDYMTRSAMDRLRASDKLKISALPMPPDIGLMIARYRTFGVDGFDPRDPTGHRRVCSVGAAMTLVEAVPTLREIADGLSPETVLSEDGRDWLRDRIATILSGLLSIEIDAGLL